jgi:hypothetical protein
MDTHSRILRDHGWFHGIQGKPAHPRLFPDELESYSLTGNGDFPRISKAEIDDKSKANAISKGVVILQTGWFVTQCIARGAQGLPITELELATVAFAALNFVIYVLWWDKPLNVRRGVRVYKKRITEELIDDGNAAATVRFWGALLDAVSDIPAAIVRGPDLPSFIFTDSPWLIRVLLWPLYKPAIILLPLDDVDEANFEKRVNTFYPAKWVTSSVNSSIFLVVTITVVFGAIHCIGWSFDFPSSIERTFWRVASLCITAVPILIVPFGISGTVIDKFYDSLSQSNGFCWYMTEILPLVLYILSRLALLVLPFLCLRSLPPATFHVVHWVSFIPHI